MTSPLLKTRRAVLGVVLALSVAATSGCATPPEPPESHDGRDINPPKPPPGPDPADPTDQTDQTAGSTPVPADEAFDEDMQAAVFVVDQYWATHWSDNFTGTYVAPTVHGDYDGSPDLTCGDEPIPQDNAFYCPDGDYIAWDGSYMASQHASGDSFVYVTIAHEWGHAIQYRLDPSLVYEARELQADCLAGAALEGAIADGQLELDAGDTDEIVETFVLVGDAEPWTDESSHGTAEQRQAAFEVGLTDGVPGCLPAG